MRPILVIIDIVTINYLSLMFLNLLNKDLIREILDLDKKDSPEFVEADTVVDYKKWQQSKLK